MNDHSFITQEMFDEKLEELVERMPAGAILAVPGVYEAFSEHLNNDVLDELYNENQPQEEEEEEEG